MKGANRFIKKKAILCSVSMIKKDKMFVKEFTDVNTSLLKTDKNHGILLGVMAFMNELL